DRRKHAADKQTTPDPTHAKTATSCLPLGYADAPIVTTSGLKIVTAWRKEALRPGQLKNILTPLLSGLY
ncbi:hypothetical protein, partial [Desulfosalsimonas propionicica]|uniref:hypothetical protein n=1 Tax=Desulfosalsimonas propionicica TaxID=332175 RepID=UPI001C685A3C